MNFYPDLLASVHFIGYCLAIIAATAFVGVIALMGLLSQSQIRNTLLSEKKK